MYKRGRHCSAFLVRGSLDLSVHRGPRCCFFRLSPLYSFDLPAAFPTALPDFSSLGPGQAKPCSSFPCSAVTCNKATAVHLLSIILWIWPAQWSCGPVSPNWGQRQYKDFVRETLSFGHSARVALHEQMLMKTPTKSRETFILCRDKQ